MKLLLKLEELSIFILVTILAFKINNSLIIYLICSLLPDISMIGYLVNNKIGAFIYNLVHHKALGIIILGLGLATEMQIYQYAGLILIAHSSIDRVLGLGLKYSDNFKHTHLE